MAAETNMIVSELLCYIQNKIDTNDHEYLIKIVSEYYSEREIKDAKALLFEKCKMTTIRLKSYNENAAKMDCRDIINKLNEVGLECPTFVAKSVAKLPLATPDAFNLTKISKDIANILRIEEHVTTSFYALSCLQKDFRYVMDKCADIEPLTRKIESLHNLLNKQNARQVIFSDSGESDSNSNDESCVDVENYDTDTNRDKSFHVKYPVLKQRNSHSNTNNVKENKQTQQHQAPRDPSDSDKPLDDDFTLVTNRKNGNNKDRPRTYGEIAGLQQTRVFTNSKRYQTHNVTLRSADSSRRENTRRNSEHNRNTKKKCEIFVSNLHPETTSSDVMRYLKAEYKEYFKI